MSRNLRDRLHCTNARFSTAAAGTTSRRRPGRPGGNLRGGLASRVLVAIATLLLADPGAVLAQQIQEWQVSVGGFGDWRWQDPVADVDALPEVGATGACHLVLFPPNDAPPAAYCWDGEAWLASGRLPTAAEVSLEAGACSASTDVQEGFGSLCTAIANATPPDTACSGTNKLREWSLAGGFVCAADEGPAAGQYLPAGGEVSMPDIGTANAVWGMPGALVFEGSAADSAETQIVVTNPTAGRTVTIPDADSVTVQAADCSPGDFVVGINVDGSPNCDTPAGGGGSGDVVGPASATDECFARYDTTTGKLLQNGVVCSTDAGAITGVTSIATPATNTNLALEPHGSGAVEVAGATAPGRINVYGARTDASNYLRLLLDAGSNYGSLVLEGAGTGAGETIFYISNVNQAALRFGTGGTGRWLLEGGAGVAGNWTAISDNVYDIGASASGRPRAIYVGTQVTVGEVRLTPGAVGTCGAGQAGYQRAAADGTLCSCNGMVWTPTPLTGSCS